MTDTCEFRSWVRRLRREFPGRFPVVVRLVSASFLSSIHGEVVCGESCFDDERLRCLIRIADNQSDVQTRDTLLEEWAHYLQAHVPEPCRGDDHGPVFTAFYSLLLTSFRGDHETEE